MFPYESLDDCSRILAARINPIERKLIGEAVDRNSSLFSQRTQTIFGQLQVAHVQQTKESSTLPQSYASTVDLTPKVIDTQRLTLIPRLGKSKVSAAYDILSKQSMNILGRSRKHCKTNTSS